MKMCFDDILLVPRYSELTSRTSPNISTKIGTLDLKIPIISAPMDSITGQEMLITMDKIGGIGILTRYIDMLDATEIARQVSEIKYAKDNGASLVGCAIGIKNDVKNKATQLLDVGCNIICLDVAHGDHTKMYQAIEVLINLIGIYDFTIMAGNVCTIPGAQRFANNGVDIIKVGIGPGSACTTRTITGFGYPQFSAIEEISEIMKENSYNVSIICDGGIRDSGDIVKALLAGADAVMVGYILAGTDSTPVIDNKRMIRGMSSRMVSNRSNIAPEGIEIEVGDCGNTESIIKEYCMGIKSGLAMGGVNNIQDLRSNVGYIQVSPLSMKETLPCTK